MLFLLAYGRRYVLGLLGLFDDLERRQLVRRVLFFGARRGRLYILCTLAHSFVNGVVFGVACWLLDLAAPGQPRRRRGADDRDSTDRHRRRWRAGVAAGVRIELVGRSGSRWLALLVTMQAVEVLVVRPFVDGRSVRVGTTIAVVVALVAFDLYGIGAAICAVALAAIALAALDVYGTHRDEELAAATE